MKDNRYNEIAKKIDEAPQTAPKTKDGTGFHPSFIEYLKIVYEPAEADLVRHLCVPIEFKTAKDVADISGIDIESVTKVLENLCNRNSILGMAGVYCLPPIQLLVNIHQFYSDTKPDDVKAGLLYKEYFIEGGYYRYYESSEKGTQALRTIPVHNTIEAEQKVVLAEEAHDFILNHAPEEMALVPCPCRTRTEKLGIRECKDQFPIAFCIMMGPSAIYFESLGLGKRVNREQAIQYFDEMNEMGLIGNTNNSIKDAHVICLCCGCCCSNVRGRTKWKNPEAISPSNFLPQASEDCVGCGACVDSCLLSALSINNDSDQVEVSIDKCLGCGVCTFACPQDSLKLYRFERSKPFKTADELYEKIAMDNRI